ncbi:MAG: GNAT family N-acetyltransferase, partial [Gemmataceae bacterium]
MPTVQISLARKTTVIGAVKGLADTHRHELGFHTRESYLESLHRSELVVAEDCGQLAGFVRFHKRRDLAATIYEIVTAPRYRRMQVASQLITAVIRACHEHGVRLLRLSCPAELEANQFYPKVGFTRASTRSRPGKNRPLIEWELPILPARPVTFVAALSNSANDLKHLIRLWEAGGESRPFERCIITPLFTDNRTLKHVRYIRERWGVEVVFDSGGFFVQQGKVTYDELFPKLLDYYAKNDWAAIYVLPDF